MVEPKDIIPFFYQLSNPSSKAALTISNIDYKVIRTFEVKVPKMISESILLEPHAACIFPSNFAFKLVENTMIRLVEAGILQYHFNFLVNFELKLLFEAEWKPKVFNLSDLEFGFVTWLITCGIAVGIFVAQFLWCIFKREFRSLCALFAILQFLRNYRVVGF